MNISKNAYSSLGFRFNGKELDPDLSEAKAFAPLKNKLSGKKTGNYYYGARYYDPKISVWLSVDPYAEKYPSLSPYNAFANNPINVADPNGDTIVVKFGGFLGIGATHAQYNEDGTWTNQKTGEQIDSDNKYFQDVRGAIETLNSKEEGASLVTTLAQSEHTFTIRRTSTYGDNYKPDSEELAGTYGIGSGGTIWLSKRQLDNPLFITLGHEMGHASQSHFGLTNNKNWGGTPFLMDEIPAMHYENLIRQEHKLPLQPFYDDRYPGTRVLDRKGNSIYTPQLR